MAKTRYVSSTEAACGRCKRIKPLGEFAARSKRGFIPGMCTACHALYSKEWRARPAVRNRIARRYKGPTRLQAFVWDYLKTHACVDCGQNDPIVLEFDHVRGTKTAGIARLVGKNVPMDILVAEMAKCDIRCANCHRRRTARQRGWYHKKMSLQFSRLECRELLSHVNRASIDPDVLAKLEYGATNLAVPNPARLVTPQHSPIITPAAEAATVQVGSVDSFTPMRLTEAMVAKGWTQADVDTANEQTRIAWEAQQRIRKNYRPIIGKENEANPNAAYAPPDIPPSPAVPLVKIGEKNQWGDECAAYQGSEPVFRCKEGHGYVYNRTVAGCPQCFLGGISSGEETTEAPARRDEGRVAGEDSDW